MKKKFFKAAAVLFAAANITSPVNAEQTNINSQWAEIYKNYIDELVDNDGKTPFSVAVCDIDKDSTPELLTESYEDDPENPENTIEILRIYDIANSEIREIYSCEKNYTDIFASNDAGIFLVVKDGFNSTKVNKYITFEKSENSQSTSEILPKEHSVLTEWYGSPITFVGFLDEYGLNTIFSAEKPFTAFSIDSKQIEEYPQMSSPEIFINDFVPEGSPYENFYADGTHETGVDNLLMINGIFIGGCEVFEENGKTFVPLRTAFEKTGKTVSYNNADKTIDVIGSNSAIKINLSENNASIGSKNSDCIEMIDLSADLKSKNGHTYISQEVLSEYFGLETGTTEALIHDLGYKIAYVENIYQNNVITVDNAKKAIVDNFKMLEDENEKRAEKYGAPMEEKFNVMEEHIKYIGDLGRYYIFKTEKEDVFWNGILFNKYTGEIFSEWSGFGRGLGYGQYMTIVDGKKIHLVG